MKNIIIVILVSILGLLSVSSFPLLALPKVVVPSLISFLQYLKGTAALELGRLSEAGRLLEEAVQAAPSHIEAAYNLRLVQERLQVQNLREEIDSLVRFVFLPHHLSPTPPGTRHPLSSCPCSIVSSVILRCLHFRAASWLRQSL